MNAATEKQWSQSTSLQFMNETVTHVTIETRVGFIILMHIAIVFSMCIGS